MPTREFHDANGRFWLVWDVYPTLTERRLRDAGPPDGYRERRRFVATRPHISPRMAGGWLTFESRDGERRRLVPIPTTHEPWDTATEQQLRNWLAAAEPAPPPRRLIE